MYRLLCCLVVSSLLWSAAPDAAAAGAPLGFWKCSLGKQKLYLALLGNGMLSFDGSGARYKVSGATLQVQQEGRWVSYPFRLRNKGRALTVTVPSGKRLVCGRVSPRGTAALRGMLCSWSGGSSSYGGTSISRTTRVRFDGRGTLTYASEGSFSGPSGMAGSRSGKKSGLYRVVGNNILLVFPDGSGDMARIHLRQTSGRITEVKFRGKLYATGLCK